MQNDEEIYFEEELKLDKIVDEIVGFENHTFTLKYENGPKAKCLDTGSIFNEEYIKDFAERLKERYPGHLQAGLFFPLPIDYDGRYVSLRFAVDTIIDSDPNRWRGRTGPYVYSENDRQRIVQRCAEGVAQRLKKYAKNYKVQYKIFDNGTVGFRYE